MIKILCVGKIKDKNLSAMIDSYLDKIKHYHNINIIEVKDEPITTNEKDVLEKEADRLLEKARAQILSLLGVNDYDCIFTSGATEANNSAIKGK